MNHNQNHANYSKLELAAYYGLKAVFNYTNKRGETRDRRLSVDYFDGKQVSGESYALDGSHEGYKLFNLDRINGPVTIR